MVARAVSRSARLAWRAALEPRLVGGGPVAVDLEEEVPLLDAVSLAGGQVDDLAHDEGHISTLFSAWILPLAVTFETMSCFSTRTARTGTALPFWREQAAAPPARTTAPTAASRTTRFLVQPRLVLTAATRPSDVRVQRELPRMRPQPDGIHLVLALVVDPRLDEVRGEDLSLEQERVVLLEGVEHHVERSRELLDPLGLRLRQLVEVLVDGLAGVDLVGDPVEAGHEAGREREVRVAGRIRGAELDALRLLGAGVHRDAHAGRPVALAVDEVDRRLVAGHA